MNNNDPSIAQLLKIRARARVSDAFTERLMQRIDATPRKGADTKARPRRLAVAAAVAALVAVSAAAIGVIVSRDNSEPQPLQVEPPTDTPTAATATPIAYMNAPLAVIIDDICTRYGCTARYDSDTAKDIRLHITIHPEASLEEAVAVLNSFDNISIAIESDTLIIIR